MKTISNLDEAIAQILDRQAEIPAGRALLVAISGIDGSGKGYLTAKLAACLTPTRLRIATINIDGWLNLPHRRFSQERPAQHFYEHGIRFPEMFDRLVLPLKQKRSLYLEADLAEETASTYHQHLYKFENVDVILLEGIYLLKQAFQPYYDLSIWIDCTFETALERAIDRAQEGLPPEETIGAYRTIYFPAQEIHFQRDRPLDAATLILNNDPRLSK